MTKGVVNGQQRQLPRHHSSLVCLLTNWFGVCSGWIVVGVFWWRPNSYSCTGGDEEKLQCKDVREGKGVAQGGNDSVIVYALGPWT